MQSDERLVTLVRRGNHAAFGVLVSRYEARLLAFCRHLLRSREDAEDVLQDVFASAFKAMMGDDRPIKVRPWLYRIARNRCLNHLRRITAIGVDSIEDHFSEHGPSTSDAAQRREDLWQLVGDIQALPETQRSALLLREMEALSYEQIAEVMDKTIPSVKSLLIRARRALAESAEARALTCPEAMLEVGECHLGERKQVSRVASRHLGECARCSHLGLPEETLSGVRAWMLGPLYLLKRVGVSHVLHSARAGSTATATAAGAGAAAGQSVAGGSAVAGFVSAGIAKAAVGLTAAALGVAGAVVVDNDVHAPARAPAPAKAAAAVQPSDGASGGVGLSAAVPGRTGRARAPLHHVPARAVPVTATTTVSASAAAKAKAAAAKAAAAKAAAAKKAAAKDHIAASTGTVAAASTGTVAAGTPVVSAPSGGVAPTGQVGTGGATTTAPSTVTGPGSTSTATTPTSTTPSGVPTSTTPTTSTETTSTTPTSTDTTGTTPTPTG
ncbi:MAG TPA: RNA polymerase sigma factor [Solirubrobacteraceae bacterium]|nr:RNA polymerase sigma factor [Solirubrobacteraceae bacterium]